MLVHTLARALNRASRLGFWICLCLETSSASADSCLDSPVLNQEWGWIGLVAHPEFVGDWRLEVSSRNSALTRAHAKVQLAQNPDGSGWAAQVLFAYPANPPEGLPYTFQKLQLQYRTSDGQQTAEIDWTKGCSQVGHSLFPGQEFAISVQLPGTQNAKFLESPRFTLWGSQN